MIGSNPWLGLSWKRRPGSSIEKPWRIDTVIQGVHPLKLLLYQRLLPTKRPFGIVGNESTKGSAPEVMTVPLATTRAKKEQALLVPSLF